MCLVCLEYLKDNLTLNEFEHNFKEYKTEDHSSSELEVAEKIRKDKDELNRRTS